MIKEAAGNAPPDAPKKRGRPKGSLNKSTLIGRGVLTTLFEENKGKAQEKLNAIEDPADWMKAYLAIARFVVPELNRTQVEGAEGAPLVVQIIPRREPT